MRQLRSSTSPACRALPHPPGSVVALPTPARERPRERPRTPSRGATARRLGVLLGLALLTVLALIPASAALAAGSHGHHARARVLHRRIHHTARCARRTRHSRYRRTHHRTRHHSRAHRSRFPSCAGAHHRRHTVRKHHAAVHRSAPRPVSHATASAGANGTATIAAPGGACEGSGLQPGEADLAAVRAATLCLVNRERESHGQGPLATNTELQDAAQGHSESMASGAYFEHTGPGGSFLERIRASGYLPGPNALYSVGENIAYGSLQDATPGAIVAAWMASPGHRANILNSAFREVGIGIVPRLPASLGRGQAGAMYTEDFGVVM